MLIKLRREMSSNRSEAESKATEICWLERRVQKTDEIADADALCVVRECNN